MKKDDGENIGPLDSLNLSSKSLSGSSLTPTSGDRKNILSKA